ncbi:MAG: ABC transporter transmembrane domain-containing protein, partial [Pseudomonadota bacterium]
MQKSSPTDWPEQRQAELRIILRVLPYIWPDGELWVKIRLIAALSCLIIAKLVGFGTPLLFGYAVDDLSGDGDQGWVFALGAAGLTMAYGTSRLLEVGFAQLQSVIFAKVAQRSLRKIGLQTFQHIHALSLRYHISRKTGGLSRIMERGIKGVAFLLRFLVFSIGPLIFQMVLVCVAMVAFFDWRYLVVIVVAIVAYIWFTMVITEWRVRIRKQMNDQDQDANQKAIDSLLNF